MTSLRALLVATTMFASAAAPAHAQDEEGLVIYQSLKPEIALQLAKAAMEACREEGYQVGVAVVDHSGVLQVFIRDRYAGAHTIETAIRKAWTAVSFRTNTWELEEATRPGEIAAAIRHIGQALPLGGGMMVRSAGSLVGGVGVSGAPGPERDDVCAKAGIEAIEDALPF